jgi:hypothetical protein
MPPAVTIRIALEERLIVWTDCVTDGDYARLWDWIAAHPELRALLEHAGALALREKR